MINHEEAQYTIRVIDIIQGLNEIDMYSPITDEQIKRARQKIFYFDYPMAQENKDILETNFLWHFLQREISTTPLVNWLYYVRDCFQTNATKWEKLLNAEKINFEWDKPYNMVEASDYTGDSTGRATNTGNQSNKTDSQGQTVGSNFPQATLNGRDYATTGNTDKTSVESEASSTGETTSNAHVENTNNVVKKGSVSDISQLYKNYRDSVYSVLNTIYDDMSILFYAIY